jgi:hypothetical protein
MHRLATRVCAVTSLLLAAVTAAHADCAGTSTVDRCLVGKWEMTTNGAQDWMKKHIKGFRISSVKASGNTITLNADGTFATGASHVTATGTSANGTTGTSTMDAQASGKWSAANGKFNLCPVTSTIEGSTSVTAGGRAATAPIHQNAPQESSQSYACEAKTFSVTQILRGDAVVSTYTKVTP